MYTKEDRIYNNVVGLANYIEGSDIYNSKLLYLLSNPSLPKSGYVIKTPYRPDLIATEFYNDSLYEPYVILQLKRSISTLERGEVIYLITKQTIDNILTKL